MAGRQGWIEMKTKDMTRQPASSDFAGNFCEVGRTIVKLDCAMVIFSRNIIGILYPQMKPKK